MSEVLRPWSLRHTEGSTALLTINLAPEVHQELQALAKERNITVSDLIKRAVALDKFVWEHRNAELLIKDGDTVRQIVLISG